MYLFYDIKKYLYCVIIQLIKDNYIVDIEIDVYNYNFIIIS